jgi:hydroxymethylglutaryl-CoA lyase
MRIRLLKTLQRARLPCIEAGSFVSAKFMPQFQDTAELLHRARLHDYSGQLAVLVPNLKYYQQHKSSGPFDTVAMFLSASEAYSQKNKRVSIEQDLADAKELAAAARADGRRVRAHLSGAFRDPIEQVPADLHIVARICVELLDAGCEHVSLADTDGRAARGDLERIIPQLDVTRVALHLHDRSGQAIAQALLALDLGVRIFDSAVGGIGGNTAVIDSAGNIATETLARSFEARGLETSLDLNALAEACRIVKEMAELVGEPDISRGS